MRAGWVPAGAMLLTIVAGSFLCVYAAEDLYWEGEEDASNEFLEVKDNEASVLGGHIRRIRDSFWSSFGFGSSSTTEPPEPVEDTTDDLIDDTVKEDEESESFYGSGASIHSPPYTSKEKTVRVSFVVMEPYKNEYSNRDSSEFKSLSQSLSTAVNALYQGLPGIQRASLVRIQSRISDNFSCKVTLDIVTSDYDNTKKITQDLRDHIRNLGTLGTFIVNDSDFNSFDIDPDVGPDVPPDCGPEDLRCNNDKCVPNSARCNRVRDCDDGSDEMNCSYNSPPECVAGNFRCDNGQCVDGVARCDHRQDCEDGSDEYNCYDESDTFDKEEQTEDRSRPATNTDQRPYDPYTYSPECNETIPCSGTLANICIDRKCDGITDCPNGDDEEGCSNYETTVCQPGYMTCDQTRCVPLTNKCDGKADCDDISDERGCDNEICESDDFRCNNGKCIESVRQCDRIVDCPNGEDEDDCTCNSEEFSCATGGACIEIRKRCDGVNHCADGSDELDCFSTTACSSDQWQCDHGSCIKRSQRCDGRVDCPADRSDERNCFAASMFRCKNGKLIPQRLRCNRQYDCSPGDLSDEKNCPCGDGDFECENGFCIPATKVCDRSHDCQDGSDEKNCSNETRCMASQYKCSNGECISSVLRCDGIKHCHDGSDETTCHCESDQFRCFDGSCINTALRCNGIKDCRPRGEDEYNCNYPSMSMPCPPGLFRCNDGNCINYLKRCDGERDCSDGTDEADCGGGCAHECDGKCLDDSQICDDYLDCSDQSDELHCITCDKLDDFRCANGECINAINRCNGLRECSDGSDESNCNTTIIASGGRCLDNQFTCHNGNCINIEFQCDNHEDCDDGSDEEDCPCPSYQFQCARSGQCIELTKRCDGYEDCDDRSDEESCPTQFPPINRENTPVYTPDYEATTRQPYFNNVLNTPGGNSDGCSRNQWRCENGPCIDRHLICNGHIDCPLDSSDEMDCPPNSPVALLLKTYPDEQTIRNGGDVVFQCRDEGPQRAAVRWVREGGRPLRYGFTDVNGRLEMFQVTTQDSGVYICQASKYLGQSGSELRTYLTVEKPRPTVRPQTGACRDYEATCGNGQCISKTAVCDGHFDCSDKSDEDSCNNEAGICEPNQFKCDNRRCVLKTWVCDSEDDCGDGSDERVCGTPRPGEPCLPVEFTCKNNSQCIPKSYHCDGLSDCMDSSDEIGCSPVHITKPPQPSNVILNVGETLTLVCEAVGVPVPFITWRLNWGHIPETCTTTSDNGVGRLTCYNMQTSYSGAYSCEAINNKGTSFAVPDAIVEVRKPTATVCPSGYFNSEAQSESECIRCFCFGESSDCHSADLFTFNMPTPLGEGGTRLLGVIQNGPGLVEIDSQTVTDQYYYTPLRNGATVTKLHTFGLTRAHPYVTLPESYKGTQLTSYGGYIKYRLHPHSPRYGPDFTLPQIIIKGQFGTLLYDQRRGSGPSSMIDVEAQLVPGNWIKVDDGRQGRASREDIMMVLDNIEMILLRADWNGAGVNITDFTMQSAHHIDVGLGAASLVEECTCPPGYEGLSCQKCASGYTRQLTGSYLGICVPEVHDCPPGTYGDPKSGYACKPCPCPLTNRENQFARTCSIGYDGRIICDCAPGYEGDQCERCDRDHIGNPTIPGDSCRPRHTNDCNPIGTSEIRLPDQCVCKDNVQGRYCDRCNDDSFYLTEDFTHGCAQCFCSGVTQQCISSDLRRKTTSMRFNMPSLLDQVKVYNSTPFGPAGVVRYNAPVEVNVNVEFYRGDISITNFDRSRPTIYYWSLPINFAGDKVTSYGGFLRYNLRHISSPGSSSSKNNAADVQLISDNGLTFHYFNNIMPGNDGSVDASVQFLENGWKRPDGKEVQRAQFLLALADVKTILIKATYTTNTQIASIVSASIDTAEVGGTGPPALHVEQCVCPQGYLGTSCEDCAPGYTRRESGLYLELCGLCDCNGHSSMCHPETGVCSECGDNTAGDHCEQCRPGYDRDINGNCVPRGPRPDECRCDARGEAGPCQSGYCQCKQNVEGDYCDKCRSGTFGLDQDNPLGCTSCYCSGVTGNCHEASHYGRIPVPAPIFGDTYGGYTLMNLNSDNKIDGPFIPASNESELTYVFDSTPYEELYWSLPVFPGNRVLSYGGKLSLTQRFEADYLQYSQPGTDVILVGRYNSIYWRNPNSLRSGESLSFAVPLTEKDWYILNTNTEASRADFMAILKDLKRVLVRATLSPNIRNTAIADVSMDTATDQYSSRSSAKGVELCMCPEGYKGTSCETCASEYYRDDRGNCQACNCNGHSCHLDTYNEVRCDCRPPFTGDDCSAIGLKMELQPHIDFDDAISIFRRVNVICKYSASEPLSIQFYFEGQPIPNIKSHSDSLYDSYGYHGEHELDIQWDTRKRGQIIECHAITTTGNTKGVLTTRLPPETTPTSTTSRPPPPQSMITVTITSPSIRIQEVGSTVNFTCYARSRFSSRPLSVSWSKADGEIPHGRSVVESTGVLLITNVQESDSGVYICQATDGVLYNKAEATLKVPTNAMTLPEIQMSRPGDYYEGDRVVLECIATGNPRPIISWQRSANRALALTSRVQDSYLIIESARLEDSGEYRCIASNTAGSTDRIVMLNIRSRYTPQQREELSISPTEPRVLEGQSTRVICTGTVSVPAGSIGWTRQDRADLESNIRSDNGVLYIDVARLENQGVYICQSTSPSVPAVPVLVTVVPLSPSPNEAPNVTVNVDRLSIPTGEMASVECIPHGFPLPLIQWSKPHSELGAGVSQRGNTLIINDAREEDEGYYACEGSLQGRPVAIVYVYVDIEKREAPRVEIYPPGTQSVTLDGEYEFRCRVIAGVPEPDVTWSRPGGRQLSSTTQIQPGNILKFERISVNDEGEYTCTASSVAGEGSSSAILKVHSQPVITITPSDYINVLQGDPINIECRARGYPLPEVSIIQESPYRVLAPPSPAMATLRIPSASERDSGLYTCEAVSDAGNIKQQVSVQVERGDGGTGGIGDFEGSADGEIGNYHPNLVDMFAIEGQDTKISCNTSSDFDVRWSGPNGAPLQRNAIQTDNVLVIYNASKRDSGQYECTLIYRYTGESQKVTVTVLQVMRPPKITLHPPTQTVRPGQSPTVECVVDGDNIDRIEWRPLGRPLSRRVEIRNSTTLIFHEIEVEDAGQYECRASNYVAQSSATAEVVVSEEMDHRPSVSHDNEQFAHIGAAVHLSCNVTQSNFITWTKNNKPLPRSVQRQRDGSLYIRLAQKSDSGRYVCHIQDRYGSSTNNYINLHIVGSREEPPASLVSIEDTRRQYRVGDNVQITCRARSRDVRVRWERVGTNQYVDSRPYGDGSVLNVPNVKEADAGTYRCIGNDRYNQESYDDFNLEVLPVSGTYTYENNGNDAIYTARVNDNVDMPCTHNLDLPVTVVWKRDYKSIPSNVITNEPNLHLERVTDADAGVYICHVSNSRTAVEARSILRVTGVVPRFNGDSWLQFATIRDAYRQFDILLTIKPSDGNGLVLYNSENQGRYGDYLALVLRNGIPRLILETGSTGSGPVIVEGDRPLTLNQWHTIRLKRTNLKVSIDIDNTYTFAENAPDEWVPLDLAQPLYIGGVPDYSQLPDALRTTSGFIGCVSSLVLGHEKRNMVMDSEDRYNIDDCDTCSPNMCLNGGVCQEEQNDQGHVCLCPAGFGGLDCGRTGEACRPGICGPGKCQDTTDGYRCACPVAYTGKRCEIDQTIEYPAFRGSAYLAINTPHAGRYFHMSMKIKPSSPISDGIIMYCAESARGQGGYISLVVRDGRLEWQYDLDDGSGPVVAPSMKRLTVNEWVEVVLKKVGAKISLKVNGTDEVERILRSAVKELQLETLLFVGGYDDSITLNPNTGVTGGFNGCVKDVNVLGTDIDIINKSIHSANVQECVKYERGDVPEDDIDCSRCRNGGYCVSEDATACYCPPGFSGLYCEQRTAPVPRLSSNPCAVSPCRNGGICKENPSSSRLNYTCDCPLGFAGVSCQMALQLQRSVGFSGNGYLELPAHLLNYDRLDVEPAVIALAIFANADGIILYQNEAMSPPGRGDFILMYIDNGYIRMDWNVGGGVASITVNVFVTDGNRHQVIAKIYNDKRASLSVDEVQENGVAPGFGNVMNADSNVYIGGVPDELNVQDLPGFNGCFDQVELLNVDRGLLLGQLAVSGRNTQRCRDSRF